MSQATDKLSKLMKNLKKLPANRRAFYLKKLKTLEEIIKQIESSKSGVELGDDSQSDWLLDLANYLDKSYNIVLNKPVETIKDKSGQLLLQYANSMDKIYNAVADEVAKIPASTGKAIGKLTGTGDYWPYILGAAVALGTVYYVKNIA